MRIKKVNFIGIADRSQFPKKIRPGFKVGKMTWEFHKFDVDPWPSTPHGHSLTPYGYKLDVDNGIIYEIKTRRIYAIVKDEDMALLLNDSKFAKFLIESKKYYEENRYRHRGRSKRLIDNYRLVFELRYELIGRTRSNLYRK